MAIRISRAGRPQVKTIVRLCNELLEGSGLIVRDWQRDSLLEPLPLHKRFTLETTDGNDWDEIPCIYELHQQLHVSAGVILTHPVDVKLTHLGEDDGFFGAVDVDPGGSSGDTSDGPKGRRNQGDCQAAGLLAQHSAALFA